MAFADMSDKRIPQPDPIASQDSKFVKSFQQFTLSDPHPGYGKDPNIINEYGHTKYPKWVTNPDGERVVVNSEEEEILLTKNDIELKDNGPTIEEYVAAGYQAKDYPPKGYASKSSKKEIDAAIEKQKPKGGW